MQTNETTDKFSPTLIYRATKMRISSLYLSAMPFGFLDRRIVVQLIVSFSFLLGSQSWSF